MYTTFFFYSYDAHRDLHSFPTRRSSDLLRAVHARGRGAAGADRAGARLGRRPTEADTRPRAPRTELPGDRKSTRLNSSHPSISYAVFCLKKKKYKKI